MGVALSPNWSETTNGWFKIVFRTVSAMDETRTHHYLWEPSKQSWECYLCLDGQQFLWRKVFSLLSLSHTGHISFNRRKKYLSAINGLRPSWAKRVRNPRIFASKVRHALLGQWLKIRWNHGNRRFVRRTDGRFRRNWHIDILAMKPQWADLNDRQARTRRFCCKGQSFSSDNYYCQ